MQPRVYFYQGAGFPAWGQENIMDMDRGSALPDRGVVGWIYNVSKKNYWRVARWYEFEDLIQDGYVVYQRIKTRYPNKTPPHTAALFRTAFTNHIHDLAKKRTRLNAEVLQTDCDVDFSDLHHFYTLPNTSETIALLPATLRRLIEVMETQPHRVRSRCRVMPTHRQTTNAKLCRLIGADPAKTNLLAELLDYLAVQTHSPAV